MKDDKTPYGESMLKRLEEIKKEEKELFDSLEKKLYEIFEKNGYKKKDK